jgi:hypothetical protein
LHFPLRGCFGTHSTAEALELSSKLDTPRVRFYSETTSLSQSGKTAKEQPVSGSDSTPDRGGDDATFRFYPETLCFRAQAKAFKLEKRSIPGGFCDYRETHREALFPIFQPRGRGSF